MNFVAIKRFCVRCGKETQTLLNSLCPECYLQKNEVLDIPKTILIDFDKRSGKIRVGRDWIERSDDILQKVLSDKVLSLAKPKRLAVSDIAVSIEHVQESAIAKVSFSALVEGINLQIEKSVTIHFHKTISDASMKISSNYHEAIIQVRFIGKVTLEQGKEKLRELASFILEHKKKIELSEIIDTKNVPGGFDVFIGSSKAAKIVATKIGRKYGIRPIYSNKLMGIGENSKEKFRHTYCLKFDVSKEAKSNNEKKIGD